MGLSLLNRLKMRQWATKVEKLVRRDPGNDKGFSPVDIERSATSVFSTFSTWSIVCEEVLDTEFPCVYFERAHEELKRRGITADEILEMRRFAWLTAGWLNYEMMLWNWCHLDERDICRAIEWQFSDGWISCAERDRRIEYAKRYERKS